VSIIFAWERKVAMFENNNCWKILFFPLFLQIYVPLVFAASSQEDSSDKLNAEQHNEQEIIVVGERNQVLYPYKRAYEAAKIIKEFGKGDVVLMFGFFPRREGLSLDNIKLEIEYDGGLEQIVVDTFGQFTLTPNDAAIKGNGQFVINKRREDYGVTVDIVPSLDVNTLTLGHLKLAVQHARDARKALLPWYARIFVPIVTGIRACNDTKNISVELVDVDQSKVTIPFQEKVKNPPKGKPYCADIGQGITLSDRTLVKTPEGTVLDFISSNF